MVAVIVPSVAENDPEPFCSVGFEEVPVKVNVSERCVGVKVMLAGLAALSAVEKPLGVTVMALPAYPVPKAAVTVMLVPTPEKNCDVPEV